MPSLGHAAPFGVGAYAAGITARDLSTFAPVPLLAAVLAGAVFSALTGWLIVRSRGTYLLMLTLAVAELAHTLASRWEDLTGGSNGLVGIPALTLVPGGEPIRLVGIRYWWVLLVFLAGFAVIAWTARSNLGRSLRGLRDNEERMSSLGYSVFTLKYSVFCITGAVAGAAGAAWVATARFVSPEDLGFEVSAMALLAIVVGGRGRLWGAVLGAALVTLVRDEIGTQLGGRGPLLLGLVFIAVVYLLPRGFAGTPWRRLLQRQKET
jgi:branched-chain amino acid transport system permease protein